MDETQLKPHLQCGTDPRPIRAWSENDPTTHETVSQPSHRRGRSSRFGDGLCMEKHIYRLSCICYLSKTHFVRDFLQNSIGNSSTSTTCNPIYSEGTILELQITMEFHRQLIHQHHLQPHLQCGNDPTVANHNEILSTAHGRNTVETSFTMRNRSETDPTTHETVSQPSHRRGRSSRFGDGLCMEKHIGFRASAISQKRISCETSFKTPSATPPPAPLAIPFTVREQFLWLTRSLTNSFTSTTCNPIYNDGNWSYSCKSQWNSVDRTWTKHSWNLIWQCGTRSETDPTTHETVRNRRTAEVDHRGSGTDSCPWKNI